MPYNQDVSFTEEEIAYIKSLMPDKMPLNPTAQGWTGNEVRRYLSRAITQFLETMTVKLENAETRVETLEGEGAVFSNVIISSEEPDLTNVKANTLWMHIDE